MQTNINGVGVALVTPFKSDDSIDFTALTALVEFVSEGGVNYLVPLGTTAETPTLSLEERRQILACVKAANKKSLPLVVGVGGNCTAEIVKMLKEEDYSGCDAILSVTPYYNKPSQEGLYQHYKAVCEASPLPVILYNVPGRTGVNMTSETTLRLANTVPNILGVKEASGSLTQMAEIIRSAPEGFMVISGDDCLTLPLKSLGGDGVISVAANAFAPVFMQMYNAAQQGDMATATALQLRMLPATQALFEEGNPVGIKAVLNIKGKMQNKLRLPLVSSSDKLYAKLEQLVKQDNL
ncbi:MAG: 4-hydroxy-tetrahydrodipicolinate synthase [Rikenellaceae bacterium]